MRYLFVMLAMFLQIVAQDVYAQKRKVEVDQFTGDKTTTYTFGITNLLFEIKSTKKGDEESHKIILLQGASSQDFFSKQNSVLKKLELLLNSGESVLLTETDMDGLFGITNTALGYYAIATIEITPNLLNLMRQCKSFRIEGIGNGANLGNYGKKVNGVIDLFLEDNPGFRNEKGT